MRRQNSDIAVKFLTNAGTHLFNNDYYGSAELTDYACYVVADGIEEGSLEDISAQIAVEAVINAFSEHPGMSKLSIYRYIQEAQKALVNNSFSSRLRASIAFIITDYQKARIVHVGNTRATIFRKSLVEFETYDDSLSWDLMEQGEITKDKIAKHEERSNLSKYLGQYGKIMPNISKKIKLREGDVFALYSRGIWENCDQFDIITSFAESDADLELSLENVSRVVTDVEAPNFILPVGQRKRGRPKKERGTKRNIENYTIALGFVDKLYVDPNKGKRLKLLLKILIPLLIILLIIGVIVFFWTRDRRLKREEMQMLYTSGVEYIVDENFTRATSDLDSAQALAVKLSDKAWQTEISNHQKLVEAIVLADNLMGEEKYAEAQQAYLRARERSRYTNHIGDDRNNLFYLNDEFSEYQLAKGYIDRQLEKSGNYASVHDLLMLGDSLTDQKNYEMAEEKYLSARALSSRIHYMEGKNEAIASLERMYEKLAEDIAAKEDEMQAALQTEVVAAELVSQGDNAFIEGDLVGAQLFYEMAKDKYTELGNTEIVKNVDERIRLLSEKQSSNDTQLTIAENYVVQGDAYLDKSLYTSAKRQYILARDIYSKIGTDSQLKSIESKIEKVDTYITQEEINSARSNGREDANSKLTK